MEELGKLKKEFDAVQVPPEIDFAIENAIRRGKKRKIFFKFALPFSAIVAVAAVFIIAVNVSGAFFKTVSKVPLLSKASSSVMFNSKCAGVYTDSKLPIVGSLENLKKFASQKDGSIQFKAVHGKWTEDSSLNVKIDGVDKGDTIKNDGRYIYEISDNKILIVKAYPEGRMKVISSIYIGQTNYAYNIYAYKNYLIIMMYPRGAGSAAEGNNSQNVKGSVIYKNNPELLQSDKVVIYDIKNKSKPEMVREIGMDGNSCSGIADGKLYVMTQMPLDESSTSIRYYDSLNNKGWQKIDYSQINYFPGADYSKCLMIASIYLDKIDSNAKIFTSLGSIQKLYWIKNNIYLSYKTQDKGEEASSTIYKFSVKDGQLKLIAEGKVPGNIIDQNAMDEEDGYLRVVSKQAYPVYRNDSSGYSENSVFVLDSNMKVIGKIEKIVIDDGTPLVDFMHKRAYVVSYPKGTEQILVVDLKDPQKPEVLGNLKISGFNNYIFKPYDDTHIISFSQNSDGSAATKDMKIALLDVSDVNKPIQMFTTSIGSSGIGSPEIDYRETTLFSEEKGLLAFIEIENDENHAYNSSTAYVYNVNLKKGFTLKGKVPQDNCKSKGDDICIKKIINIKDTLYIIEKDCIKAFDINTMAEKEKLVTD